MRARAVLGIVVLAAAAVGLALYQRATCPRDPAPRQAVVSYLEAMKAGRFADAYDFVTPTMTDGRPREEWAGLQRKMFELGGVSLGDIDVHPARRMHVTALSCADTAQVPNVLHATDRLNNQGSTEFEIYTVVRQDGQWRIDSQETLFDESKIQEWFSGMTIPALKDTR